MKRSFPHPAKLLFCAVAAAAMIHGPDAIATADDGDGKPAGESRERGRFDQRRGPGGPGGPRPGGPRLGGPGPQGDRPGFRGQRDGNGPGGPRGAGGPGGRGGDFMSRLPIFAALDKNKDGRLSSDEISNAPAALRKLDKNGDGGIDQMEMRPQMGQMRGPGGERGLGGNRPPAGPQRSDRADGPPRGDRPDGPSRGDRAGGPRGDRPDGPPRGDRAGGPRGDRPEGPPRGDGDRPQGQRPGPELIMQRMKEADKNGDGFLTAEELQGRGQRMLQAGDSDGDGKLSQDEIRAVIKRFMQNNGQRPGGNRGSRRGGGQEGATPGGERPRRPPAEE